MRGRASVVVALLAALVERASGQTPDTPASAEAVGELPAPSFWEGGGLLVGDSTLLHPSLSLGTSYQSNVFFQDSADLPSGPIASPVLRLGVGTSWATRTLGRMEIEAPSGEAAPQRLNFHLDANLVWNQYMSDNAAVRDQSDLAIGFIGGMKLNPQGNLTLELNDGFVRNVTPGPTLREDADRDRNELTAQAHYKPGGGALDFYLGYGFIVDVFESSLLGHDNRVMHSGLAGVKWQWLPRTVLSLEGTLASVSLPSSDFKPGSTPLRLTAGLSSLLTPFVGVVATAGYGNGFYERSESISTWLAQLELRYAPGPTIRLAAGYSHDFADALIGNFYVDHALYVRASAQLGARWQARLRAEGRLRDYGGVVDLPNLTVCGDASCSRSRSDVLPRVEAAVDLAVLPWLIATASYAFQADMTDFFVRSGATVDRGAFVWHEVNLILAARW